LIKSKSREKIGEDAMSLTIKQAKDDIIVEE
jgi:hypothetical protein